jgi:hypothetical protein
VTCKENNTSNDLIPSIETLFAAHTASGFKTEVNLPMRQSVLVHIAYCVTFSEPQEIVQRIFF